MASLLTAAADASCTCPSCERMLRVNLSFAGRLARCRHCGEPFRVPPRRELIDHAASFLIAEDVEAEFAARESRATWGTN
jgi:hypothetical protein